MTTADRLAKWQRLEQAAKGRYEYWERRQVYYARLCQTEQSAAAENMRQFTLAQSLRSWRVLTYCVRRQVPILAAMVVEQNQLAALWIIE